MSRFSVAIITIFGLLIYPVRSMAALGYSTSGQALWDLGFGHKLNPQTMITGWALANITSQTAAVIANVLVANSPQVILAFLYFVLDGYGNSP